MADSDSTGNLIPSCDVRPGDILVFKGNGPVYEILSRILKLFEPGWDRWGWHVGFALSSETICEAIGNGVVVSWLHKYPENGIRAYRWFSEQPSQDKIEKYVKEHLGKRYDVAIYFWTMLQYLVRHFWNKRIPRLLDDRYTCWENVFEFCEDMGKPIGAKYDCPLITDMLKAFGKC